MVSEGSKTGLKDKHVSCLNPCSCGGWSQSIKSVDVYNKECEVLILVLVEDGLREQGMPTESCLSKSCLNPCSCGGWSQRAWRRYLRRILGQS